MRDVKKKYDAIIIDKGSESWIFYDKEKLDQNINNILFIFNNNISAQGYILIDKQYYEQFLKQYAWELMNQFKYKKMLFLYNGDYTPYVILYKNDNTIKNIERKYPGMVSDSFDKLYTFNDGIFFQPNTNKSAISINERQETFLIDNYENKYENKHDQKPALNDYDNHENKHTNEQKPALNENKHEIFCSTSKINIKNQTKLDNDLFNNKTLIKEIMPNSGNSGNVITKLQLTFEHHNKITSVYDFDASLIKNIPGSTVYKLYDKIIQVECALKINDVIGFIKDSLNESKCNLLRTRTHSSNWIFMELASNDMDKLINNIDNTKKISIIEDIRKQLICLYDEGYTYTDITIQNILYKCDTTNDNVSKIFLGNLELISENINMTYPPVKYINNIGVLESVVKKVDLPNILGWGIGILIAQFLNINISILHKDNKFDNEKKILGLQLIQKQIDNNYKDKEYSKFLNIIPSDRPTIYLSLI